MLNITSESKSIFILLHRQKLTCHLAFYRISICRLVCFRNLKGMELQITLYTMIIYFDIVHIHYKSIFVCNSSKLKTCNFRASTCLSMYELTTSHATDDATIK